MKCLYLFVLLALFGCEATDNRFHSREREPSGVISFQDDSTQFNNVVGWKNIVGDSSALIVVNAHESNSELAMRRAEKIVGAVGDSKNLYVAYRYTNHREDSGYVEVFTLSESEDVNDILSTVQAKTLDLSIGKLFSEELVRGLERDVSRLTVVVPSDITPVEQLGKLVQKFGWRLLGSPELKDGNGVLVRSFSFEMTLVVGDREMLTEMEITQLVNEWLSLYVGESSEYHVSADVVEKGVLIEL
ncbi:hypothetical protein KUL42_38930 [Alteromonas sp. KUL42]|uniref:hypothetical protein n=1 Tax=Alteromonas sp. KUL42 TaxID=2480797 RepID=UPI001035D85E|nr:hypothetical protein [Alteromonas sp. KUL42]TAP31700.1 hypothetical protein EYR97_19620 [Alteromonas sp. KUL42]GEA09132.1 hypothetical protein KUL42_38930 [Alteromonas sp. KUL42]